MYNVSEVAGIPGFDVRINFTNITTNNIYYNLTINLKYTGPSTSTHQVNVELQNNSGNWITLGEFSNTASFTNKNFTISNSSNYINSSVIRARIYHDETGNINHDLSIDYIKLDYQKYIVLNNSWQVIEEDSYYLGKTDIWLYSDYACNYSYWKNYQPNLYFRQVCEGCLYSEEVV